MMFSLRGSILIEPMRRLRGSITKEETPRHTDVLRGPMSYDILEELGKRNEARVKKLIADMGTQWIGHLNYRGKKK